MRALLDRKLGLGLLAGLGSLAGAGEAGAAQYACRVPLAVLCQGCAGDVTIALQPRGGCRVSFSPAPGGAVQPVSGAITLQFKRRRRNSLVAAPPGGRVPPLSRFNHREAPASSLMIANIANDPTRRVEKREVAPVPRRSVPVERLGQLPPSIDDTGTRKKCIKQPLPMTPQRSPSFRWRASCEPANGPRTRLSGWSIGN